MPASFSIAALRCCTPFSRKQEVERAAAAQGEGEAVHPEGWSCVQWLTHPDTLRGVHLSYLRSGASVVIANSYATNRHIK